MSILAIIPARSGSKGIKNKNIKKINNITLIERAYNVAKKSKIFDQIVISTDSAMYKNLLKGRKINIFSLRSKKYASDKSTDLQLLKYEIKKNEKLFKKKFSVVALLQPTSPMRTVNDLKKSFSILKKNKLDAVWTLSKIDKKFNPIKLLKIKKNRLLYYSKIGQKFIGRQLLDQYYIRNGIAYFFTRKSIINFNTILPKKSSYLIIHRKIVNIDNLQDLKNAQKVLER